MYRLAHGEAHLARPVFAALAIHLAVGAGLAGEAPSEIFVDDLRQPQVGVLLPWNRHRVYVAGTLSSQAFRGELAALLRQRYMPGATGEQPFEAIICYAPDAWGQALADDLADISTRELERRYYRLLDRPDTPPAPLQAGFSLHRVGAAVLEDASLTNRDELVNDMLSEAPSVEAFLRDRFGYCARHGEELAGWCLSEYNHGERCELGVETLPRYQWLGTARATASATLAHARSVGIREVGWHCWSANSASIGLALRLGFTEVTRYAVRFCRFGSRNDA
jgi:RimJ/RimL family protein N-acetyltransferase